MKTFTVATVAATLTLIPAPSALYAQPALTNAMTVAPMRLKPRSNTPISLHMTDDSKNVYLAIGKAAGINVLFDHDYTSRQVQIDLTGDTLDEALRIVGQVTGTFVKLMTPDTIYVATDSIVKHRDLDELQTRTFDLKKATQQTEANDIITAVRNILSPESKVILVSSESAIIMRATPAQLAAAEAIINDLDIPKKTFRLTYTVTEVDGSKTVGVQHFAMVMVGGQDVKLKQGTKIPVATGSYSAVATTGPSPSPAGVQTAFTYLDIGMNFDSTLTDEANGGLLKYSVEQSSLAPETSGLGPQDPIVRQTSLTGVSLLIVGKPLMLGSIDIPGSTRRLDVEALINPLP